MKTITEFLSTKVNPNYTKKLDNINNIEFDIDIKEEVKPYLVNFNEDSFNDDLKMVFTNMRNDNLKLLKKVKVVVKLTTAWSPKTRYTKMMNIYLSLNTDEFYERWIMTKDKKWKIYQDSRSAIKICVDKVDLLSIIQKAIEYYEK